MGARARTVPSWVISVAIHAALILIVGVFVGVGPAKTMRLVEMAVQEVSHAVSPPDPTPAPPPPASSPSTPVRARRTRATPPPTTPSPTPPTPAVDTGPAAPDAPDTAMPAAQGPAAPGGDPNGVLGGSNAPNAVLPGAGGPPAPPPERRIYDMGDLDAAPSIVGACTADVPAFARQTNQSGWVMVQFTLDPDGHVQAPRVRASSPAGVFDQAALDAIRRCRYTAPRVGGRPVSVTYRQRLRFEP